jgi:hypothetical protein
LGKHKLVAANTAEAAEAAAGASLRLVALRQEVAAVHHSMPCRCKASAADE